MKQPFNLCTKLVRWRIKFADAFCGRIKETISLETMSLDTMSLLTSYPEPDHLVTTIDWAIGDDALDLSVSMAGGMAAAIGNFDGVHLGHQQLIKAAVKGAKESGLAPAVISFSPHPRRFFSPDGKGFILSDEQDKAAFLGQLGVKYIIRLRFNDDMRTTSAEDFVTKVLPSLGVKALYAGTDFGFGNDRSGGMKMIAERGAGHGITAHPIDLIKGDEDIVSSTRIRAAIAEGDMGLAARLLGRPFIMSGTVIKGDQRGRTIGFPTANMTCGDMAIPAFGVYSISARLADHPDAPIYGGVANLGIRPTANDRGVLLEANLFGYDGDLYGQRLNIFMLDFIRPEQAFNNFDELKNQIEKDAETARIFHQNHQGQ